MRWPKYLNKYPPSVIADRTGVKAATVKRWKREGRIPQNRADAARSVKDIKIASATRRKKVLKQTHSTTLAELAGVPVETARKWKAKGEIPLEHRQFLADAFTDSPTVPPIPPPVRSRTESRLWEFHNVLWTVDQPLTDSSLLEMIATVSDYHPRTGCFYQFWFTAVAVLEEVDDVLVRYHPVRYQPGSADYTVEVYAEMYKRYNRSITALRKSLYEWLPKDSHIEQLGLIMRCRK